MSALRCSPALLRAVAAANAVASPIPGHHRAVYAILSRAKADALPLADGERWLLDSFLQLSGLSERQQARLNDIASRVERGAQCPKS